MKKRRKRVRKYRFHGIVNRLFLIKANTMSDLKRKASIAANDYFNAIDNMTVFDLSEGSHFDLARINKVCPWNVVFYGVWR